MDFTGDGLNGRLVTNHVSTPLGIDRTDVYITCVCMAVAGHLQSQSIELPLALTLNPAQDYVQAERARSAARRSRERSDECDGS